MLYKALSKIFYAKKEEHKRIYEQRFSAPFSVHLPFEIKEFNHNNSFTAFYYYPEELVLLLEQIYASHNKLLNIVNSLPLLVVKQFGLSCIVDEVYSTSAIEGIHSTHRELKEILEGSSHNKHFSSIIRKYEILTHDEIINFTSPQDIRSFYDEFTHEDIIADNPKNKLDGKIFRLESVDVRNHSGKILHRGVFPEESIISAMELALNILHDEKVPSLVRIALFHYLFVYIHPFYDGNGRTARFISSYFLSKYFNYLPALRLACVIKKQQSIYYELIHNTEREINCGDLTPFIMGFCTFCYETILDVCNTLTNEAKQIHLYETKLFEAFSDDKFALDLCLILLYASSFFGQGLTIENLMQHTGKSRNTIKRKLALLPEKSLTVIKQNRKIFYKLNTLSILNSPKISNDNILH